MQPGIGYNRQLKEKNKMNKFSGNEEKLIPTERWEEWSTMFTNGNRGRSLSIDIKKSEMDINTLANDLPLVAIDYDPVDKGNIFTISYDQKESPERHTIERPSKLVEMQDDKGIVVGVVIEDEGGVENIILFR